MQLTFEAVAESRPGPKWQQWFQRNWPDYRAWFVSRNSNDAPSLNTCMRQMRRHMPELMPTYERLLALTGDDDELVARFLSLYRPPAYISGCSQAVKSEPGQSLLIRNYDFDPALNEGLILHSAWNEHRVIAANECLWGANDGMNDAGLAVSLTFGGRTIVGDGFGIPLILRYVLEFCSTVAEAVEVLRRVPSHMAYNVTVLDRSGTYATAFLSPDRATVVKRSAVATNHQESIEWPEHARFSRTLERQRFLGKCLTNSRLGENELIAAFLKSPLYNTAYGYGFGTLYTAAYRPDRGEVAFHWPSGCWNQGFDAFREGSRVMRYSPLTEGSNGSQFGSPSQVTSPSKEKTRIDNAWQTGSRCVDETLRQTFLMVLDQLEASGCTVPAELRNEFVKHMDNAGRVPWEKLGTIWARQ